MTGVKIAFQLTAAVGFLASLYAFNVRRKVLKSDSYSPVCDISDRISCSKAFGSDYSKTLGVPNPLAGLLYYSAMALLPFFEMSLQYLFYLTLPPVVFSVYLAYISYVRQKNFCLVCSFIYLVNLALALLAVSLLK